jgi:hypothetical protein
MDLSDLGSQKWKEYTDLGDKKWTGYLDLGDNYYEKISVFSIISPFSFPKNTTQQNTF